MGAAGTVFALAETAVLPAAGSSLPSYSSADRRGHNRGDDGGEVLHGVVIQMEFSRQGLSLEKTECQLSQSRVCAVFPLMAMIP